MNKKRINLLVLIVSLVTILFAPAGFNAPQALSRSSEDFDYVPDEVLVRFNRVESVAFDEDTSLVRSILRELHGEIRTYNKREISVDNWDPKTIASRSILGDSSIIRLVVPDFIGVDLAIRFLRSLPNVDFAEKNHILRCQTGITPNDTYYADEQWTLELIDAPDAWAVYTGSSDIVVAVIDSGIDLDHEDLQNRIWTNPNDNSVDEQDNDNNSFEDDVHGWDFVDGDNDPNDAIGHGTHVAGIIGAEGNNEIGITGICWNVRLMPIRVLDNEGNTDDATLANGLDYATQNGAYVINVSVGGPGSSSVLQGAVGRALNKSKLVIAAAGNSGLDNDTSSNRVYPASYPTANIISVLATTEDDDMAFESNYGLQSVDIGAPAGDSGYGDATVFSTVPGDAYNYKHNTSIATPHVTGVAALALGMCPGLPYESIKSLIMDGIDSLLSLNGKCVSHGRLNAYSVINAIGGSSLPGTPSSLTAEPIGWNIIRLHWNDNSTNERGFEIQRRDEYQSIYIHDNCADSNSTSIVSFQDKSIDPTLERAYTYRVRATNRAGSSSFSNSVSASVPYQVPSAPSDLEAPEAVYPNVHLYWSDNANNEFNFSLERKRSGQSNWQVIASPGANVTTYVDSNVQVGSNYYYRLRASNPLGNSAYSNTILVEVIDW